MSASDSRYGSSTSPATNTKYPWGDQDEPDVSDDSPRDQRPDNGGTTARRPSFAWIEGPRLWMARPGNMFRMTKRSKIVPKWLDLSPTNRQQSTATAKEEWTEQKLDRLLDMLIREGLVEGELGSVVPARHP